MKLKYDPKDKRSIIAYAKKLIARSLNDFIEAERFSLDIRGKGSFGQLLEKYYFNYLPNSESEPDFKEAGLELKSSPLKQDKSGVLKSKERLVLNIINYLELVNQDFETSSFWKKNQNLLLVFFLYEEDQHVLDYIIKLVDEWRFSNDDLEIIKHDWETIKEKVAQGLAHEISEGDTFYLGACTKGGKGGNERPQPFSNIPAKQRAFSLKQGYVNHMIYSLAGEAGQKYGKALKSPISGQKLEFEEIIINKFKPYYGMTADSIIKALNIQLNSNAKSFYASLAKAILTGEEGKEIEEFEKAEIILKTVRLKDNDLPKEAISFPSFRYKELIEEEWDSSSIKSMLEHRFFFVFFKILPDKVVLKRVRFWKMPYEDLAKVKRVWNKTQSIVREGGIVKYVKNGIRYTNFPDSKFNEVSHVRPHGTNKDDTFPLPTADKVTGLLEYTKHCFWLNQAYVRDKIYHE